MYGAAKMGMHFVACGPEELAIQIDKDVISATEKVAAQTGAKIEITSDLKCLKGEHPRWIVSARSRLD